MIFISIIIDAEKQKGLSIVYIPGDLIQTYHKKGLYTNITGAMVELLTLLYTYIY